jgi:hypothetical protein
MSRIEATASIHLISEVGRLVKHIIVLKPQKQSFLWPVASANYQGISPGAPRADPGQAIVKRGLKRFMMLY